MEGGQGKVDVVKVMRDEAEVKGQLRIEGLMWKPPADSKWFCDPLPLPLNNLREGTVIADIIMVPAETKWLIAAKAAGLKVHYGRHMLDYQIELIGKFIGAF